MNLNPVKDINGLCDPAFFQVMEAFQQNFDQNDELGAAVAVYANGQLVVDLWGGYCDEGRTKPWKQDTIVNVFSATKGLNALCLHMLVDRGLVELNKPVVSYWPEFGNQGKENITVAQILSYQAGLPAIEKPLPPGSQFDWECMTNALANQAPFWEPGSAFGYHLMTHGFLVGEIIRRVSGKSPGTFLQEELIKPLGVDFHLGVPAEFDSRIADITFGQDTIDGEGSIINIALNNPESLMGKAVLNPPFPSDLDSEIPWNSTKWRRAEIPAANGHGNARALAKIYGALSMGGEIEGIRLISEEVIQHACGEIANGMDLVTSTTGRIALGFKLPDAESWPFSPNESAFGHPGLGGHIGFADPNARISFGYTMNRLGIAAMKLDPKAKRLINAMYQSL